MDKSPIQGCPVCGHVAKLLKTIYAAEIEAALQEYYNKPVPDLQLETYKLFRCIQCTFEFVPEATLSTARFYNWITRQGGYYPDDRWEWSEVAEAIAKAAKPLKVLEIGCGDGRFLEKLTNLDGVSIFGIDTTPYAVENCMKKGIPAFLGTTADYMKENPDMRFDRVVSFHCLEHVANPLALMKEMKMLLNKGGSLYISTPYSPMSFERSWYDPLNHPPHHFGRWNKKAYSQLAQQLEMDIAFYSPASLGVMERVAKSLTFKKWGAATRYRNASPMRHFYRQPVEIAKEILFQIGRDKVNKQVVADVVLVKLF